jgi:predicted MFS family arabinose efflux permease
MAHELQVGIPLLGQVTSTMLLLSALLGLIIGPLADRSGFRPLILLGLSAAALTLLDIGLAPTFLVLLVASATGAVADAGVLGLSIALAGTHFAGASGRRAVGWASGAAALSAIVGVPVLTLIAASAGWRVAFVTVGLAAFAVVALAVVGLPRDQPRDTPPLRVDTVLAPYRPLLRHATMRRLYGARALSAMCWMGFLTYIGAFLTHAFGIGTGHIGLIYMAGGSAFFLGNVAAGGWLAHVPMRHLAVGGYLVMALLMGMAFTARFGVRGTVILIVVAALAMGLGMVSLMTLFLAETPTGAGTTMTLSGSLFNLGAAGGGAIGGLLLAFSGYEALAIGLPLFGLGAAMLSWQPVHVAVEPPPIPLPHDQQSYPGWANSPDRS